MAINKLTLPYSNFNIGSVIDPDEFNANNSAIVTVVNNLVESANIPPVVDDDGDIVLPDYIKETYIDGAELRSPTIIGNSFIGSTGMVGMSALGTANTSVRIWAGSHANNKEEAPFRVLQNGEVRMGGTSTNPVMKITPSGHLKIGPQVTSPQYGARHMFEWDGEDVYLGTLVFRRAHFGANASDGSWWNLNTTDRPGTNFINLYSGPGNLVYTVSHSGVCRANGFVDMTPAYTGTGEDALLEISKIDDDGRGGIDHSTLPSFARVEIEEEDTSDVLESNSVGMRTMSSTPKTTEGRDLGAMISILTKGIQELTKKVYELESKS